MAPLSSQLLSTVAALLAAPSVAGSSLKILQWNPHWQCFVWNQHDCKNQAVAHVSQFLTELDIDFANFIEVENPAYTYPSPWVGLDHRCGVDVTSLTYNSRRWRPSGQSFSGCMESNDRPYMMQHFSRADGGAEHDVIVIGAHFGHFGQGFDDVKHDLEAMIHATKTTDVVLIADTNAFSSSSSSSIAGGLGMSSGHTVSTSLEPTCCFDSNFISSMTFDRIIANFGVSMTTKVLMSSPVPLWAQQVQGYKKGAFHLPVFGELSLTAETLVSAAASNRTEIVVV